jgi:hypothetical protein
MELPYNPVILFLGIYPKEHKTGYKRDTWALMFITIAFTIATLWKQPSCCTNDEWIMKCGIYTQWIITKPQGKMMWGLNVNGGNWKTSC